ncbi:MAG: acyclic terpene utilization AtuA family protein [Chloroflexota bacterium]
MGRKEIRVLCPNGHMGYGLTKEESFHLGLEARPDFIVCDSGSCDIGPGSLGSDTSVSPYEWQKHDLELMLLGGRRLGIPVIVSSAADSGANSRVNLFVDVVKELAKKHKLPKFKLGYFYSEVSKSYIKEKLQAGKVIEGLDGRPPFAEEDLDKTDKMVLMAGIHPFIKLLDMGADVIIGGRASDICPTAAAGIREGFPEALSYHMGKLIECASFCAEPYGGKESVVGTLTHDDIKVTAMHPNQRCTIASVAGHSMYERTNPFFEYFTGGMIDLTQCQYEQYDEKTTRATGARYIPAKALLAKLEGSGKVGEKYIGMAGIRDPYSIEHIDGVIEWARDQVRAKYGDSGYQLLYHVYGRNAIMKDLEPMRDARSHELCIVVEGIAPTREMAHDVAMTGTRQIFYARLPQVKGTAGLAAFLFEEVLYAGPAYQWTANHLVPLDDPMEPFSVHMTEAGI